MEEKEQIKNGLQLTADLLYQEKTEAAYRVLYPLLPKLEAFVTSIEDREIQSLLVEKMRLALDAMESEDTILLADIIQYELLDDVLNK